MCCSHFFFLSLLRLRFYDTDELFNRQKLESMGSLMRATRPGWEDDISSLYHTLQRVFADSKDSTV